MQLGLEEFLSLTLFSLLAAWCLINKNVPLLSFFLSYPLPKCMFCHCVHAWRAHQSWRTTGPDALRGAVFKRPKFIMTRSHWLYKVISTWMKSLEPPLSLLMHCLLPPLTLSIQSPNQVYDQPTNQVALKEERAHDRKKGPRTDITAAVANTNQRHQRL